MGFYVRKGFNFGPLRVNFSKSGIGLSLGVKGLRFSAGPNGSYVHAGRKGVYYKQKLPEIGESKNMLRLSWPLLTILAIVIAGIYFYLQAGGDVSVMKVLLWQQLTNWS